MAGRGKRGNNKKKPTAAQKRPAPEPEPEPIDDATAPKDTAQTVTAGEKDDGAEQGADSSINVEAQAQADTEEQDIGWMKLEHPQLANAESKVIINNQEHLALRMARLEELIRSMSLPKAGRPPRTSSNNSSRRTSLNSNVTQAEDDKVALELVQSEDFIGLIRDQFQQWLDASKKKPLTTRTKAAKADAEVFFEHLYTKALPELFSEDWEQHPLQGVLPTLKEESHVTLFVSLSKDIKAASGQAKPGKSALKSDTSAAKRKKSQVQTLSKDSQRTVVDLWSDERQPTSSSSSDQSAKKRSRAPRNIAELLEDSDGDGDYQQEDVQDENEEDDGDDGGEADDGN
ncbi:hypothetical protein CCUS01_17219 [Colletotrichum cuscutae]|uniref:Uncharacterized protein n=1 Tax=Colletotrichum cuscutae TaxID=1209917 RepID=A0AAI9Y241_9PEZI|nr:hypothetical protein CCUS01_17219 [Colletotrichum cuscutae]